ncbi:hypothetical protein AcW1_005085 [Taiwanofungus camphoratus]|nr:hypothetical protein AcW1_005085 [Antrodia cinnamomea]
MEHLPRSSPSMSVRTRSSRDPHGNEDASAVDYPPDHSPDRSLDRSPFASLSITFSLRLAHHRVPRPQVPDIALAA